MKLNKYVFYCAFWAFLIMMLNNVLNNNISLFIVQEKLGGTSEAALTSTLSLVGGMLCGFIVGIIGKKFKYTSVSIAYLLYGLSYLLIAYGNSLLTVIIGSFIVGAAMSIAMGTFPYLISISVNKSSISMALGVYTAINAVGGVISPFVINPITTTLSKVGFNAFSVGGVIGLIIYVAILFSGFQKKLVINAKNN
ncbi:MFS transporter [Lactobacillus mulieris]|uniref:MFS transporter n=1 Tax=Lactobacillus mulieris TaxID=2508708 RepID=UPI002148243C|nr:MFS transporter [Lactobacillus mulieris]MCW8073735.1 MFS transporter [Lactobacillus mulieris]MCW8106661.1 MFS transporter [Lactobacillus mulieris]MDK6269322.1 MFS transporter [Lactobacillus mulieris]MDK6564792.1 MFS transporter [Lactobacillus mulieris]MDK7349621.1 MFS transporter [Lactobacillus mulieris]